LSIAWDEKKHPLRETQADAKVREHKNSTNDEEFAEFSCLQRQLRLLYRLPCHQTVKRMRFLLF